MSAIARHLALSLLLASILSAQEGMRAVGPAQSPSSRFLSAGVDAGDYLYISGQGPRRADGTVPSAFGPQFRQALDNVRAVLESAGLTLDNVVYVHVYLTDIGCYAEMNRVFGENSTRSSGARSFRSS
jgi:enamine deaminase RidA (YjgF/YER057c/UK114 family)